MEFSAPDYIVLVVEDLERAARFYTEVLGLRLAHRAEAYAQFETGPTRLALYTRESMAATLGLALEAPAAQAPGFELGFKVESADAAYAEIVRKGARPVTPPIDRPWGQRTAYVRDPDGHLLEVAEDLRRP